MHSEQDGVWLTITDANVGFYVRNDDEWDWLRSVLTIEKIKDMLEGEYKGGKIERFEIPGIRAVHFLLREHLDRGFNSTKTLDTVWFCHFFASIADLP